MRERKRERVRQRERESGRERDTTFIELLQFKYPFLYNYPSFYVVMSKNLSGMSEA